MTGKSILVCNLTDMQINCAVTDAYNNRDNVLMQPKGKVHLSEGIKPVKEVRGLMYTYPEVTLEVDLAAEDIQQATEQGEE